MVDVRIYVYCQRIDPIHVLVQNIFHWPMMEIIEHVLRIVVVINIVVDHRMNDVYHGQRSVMEVGLILLIFTDQFNSFDFSSQ